jgi:hypothetical protein
MQSFCLAWRDQLGHLSWHWPFTTPGKTALLTFHRYVRWISSGSDEICPFSVLNPKKWFCTFSKAMAIEKMNMCADRYLIVKELSVFSGSLPAVLLNLPGEGCYDRGGHLHHQPGQVRSISDAWQWPASDSMRIRSPMERKTHHLDLKV